MICKPVGVLLLPSLFPFPSFEEMREINYSIGTEYWYDDQFAVRAGYFNEHNTKGGRKFFTFGSGVKYNVFALDFSYLINASRAINGNNPLANTMRFTLIFDFGAMENIHMHLRDLVLINLHQIQIKLILMLNIITLKIRFRTETKNTKATILNPALPYYMLNLHNFWVNLF